MITIPVVVHIIHNGEPLGLGRNIADEQIASQIEVINEDFRRLNEDASNTPAVFQPVAADIEVEFVLAKRDPEGLATSGINRVNGNRFEWLLIDNYDLKLLSQWPSADYLNIWVTALGDDFLGYAQFPISNIGGLATASNSELTDGIVVDYRSFGSVDKFPSPDLRSQYNLGRTTTHEIGHYLGLRHIWGDGGCGVDDFCEDTPQSSEDHNGLGNCSFPATSTCDSDDMFQNYMAFTDDLCMNLFTQDQKTRMVTVLDNSPRRLSLVSSKGAIEPVIVSNDLGIRSIISPGMVNCDGQITPVLDVRNYGNNTLSSAQIELSVNGISQEIVMANFSLSPLDIQNVTFQPISLPINSTYLFEFEILNVNGSVDNNTDNNARSIQVEVPEALSGGFTIDFSTGVPSNWDIRNPDDLLTWQTRSAPNGEIFNQALFVQFSRYENEGDYDFFTSPVLDFTDGASIFSFDVAYDMFPGVIGEGLLVTISQDCEDPLFEADTVYYKMAPELATVDVASGFFIPTGADDWRTEVIDLRSYAGLNNIRLSMIAKNGFGNNLYIDNLQLLLDSIPGIDLETIHSPSIASANTSPLLNLEISNSGSLVLENFNFEYVLDQQDTIKETISLALAIGERFIVERMLPTLSVGSHRLYTKVGLPNGEEDFTLNNNSIVQFFEVTNNADVLPLREAFESTSENSFTLANPDNDIGWVVDNGQAFIDLGSYVAIGEKDWLVSPALDLSDVPQADLNFDYAYSNDAGKNDGLSVFISADGGETYELTSFNRFGDDLNTVTEGAGATGPQYQNVTLSLSDYLGRENVRTAFVSTNDNGDSIYVDNIQIFITPFFINTQNNLFPNPTVNGQFNLLFDLPNKEVVTIGIYDALGHILSENSFPNTLNQTYTFDLSGQKQGIYLVKIVGQSFSNVQRVMKGN
ncbi:T9SS type A sorting domain-containing protein [Fulvivirga sp. M361]|uniref:T9SS-dependent choice-of-anchor J family protein n=1 Tax=Fulvivirga sp. M361 TaxID=2594266 RepID=UPI00117A9A69|nr:choice-of-anchor J domain-containing protein [Fulvivirga sp. M361]TRX61700.1 T9SS type A sorting domain-containing protein [Fulvivirga sp. M361]